MTGPTHLELNLERRNLLRLLFGLAVAYYRFDPLLRRSRQVAEIHRTLEIVGISIDRNTVRKWLRESWSYLADTGGVQLCKDKPLYPKERGTLLKFILGLLAARFGSMSGGYARAPVIEKLRHDLYQVGINMDVTCTKEIVREAEDAFGHLANFG